MSSRLFFSEDFIFAAEAAAIENKVSISQQIEHWAFIGKLAEDNPEVPYEILKLIIERMAEMEEDTYDPQEIN